MIFIFIMKLAPSIVKTFPSLDRQSGDLRAGCRQRSVSSGRRGPVALLASVLGLLPLSLVDAEPADSRFTTVVTASRTAQRAVEAAVPLDVITRAEIERTGARDAAEVLALHPAVQLDRSFSGSVAYVQGLEPQHVLILLDGQRVIGRVNGAIDLSRIPVERIEQIEIVRGASSVLYGSDALGGVINIVTRKARRLLSGDVALQYGGLNALDLRGSVGTRLGWGSATLTAGWHRRDAYRLDDRQLATSGSAIDEQQVSGRFDARLGKRWRLGLSGAYLRRRQDGVDSSGSGAVLDRTNLTETADVSLSPELRLGAAQLKLVGQYSFFRDQYLVNQRGGTQLDQYQETREQLGRAEAQLDWNLPRGHTLTAGGELLYERLYTPRLSSGYGDRVRCAVFAQDQWKLDKTLGLSLVPALRLDVDSQFGSNLAPKLALRLAPIPALTVRAGYGSGFRAPSFKELLLLFENTSVGYVVQGNPNLQPETSQSTNLGIEVVPTQWLLLSANAYRNDLHNLIQALTAYAGGAAGPQRFTYGNVASAYTQGVELAVRLHAGDLVSAEISYTLTDSLDQKTGRALEGRARHRANLALNLRSRSAGLDLTTRVAVVGPRPYYPDDNGDGQPEPIEAPLYALWDARLALRLPAALQLFVGAQNLLGVGDARLLTVPPRTLFMGVSGRIERN